MTAPETWEFRCTSTSTHPDRSANNAEFYGVGGHSATSHLASATATVPSFHPRDYLVKTARETLVPEASGYVDFAGHQCRRQTLAADDVLAQIELVDVLLPALPWLFYLDRCVGYVNGDGLLPRDTETWQYVCMATVTANTTTPIVGGTAGVGLGPADSGVRRVGCVVAVFNPAIGVAKTANPHRGVPDRPGDLQLYGPQHRATCRWPT